MERIPQKLPSLPHWRTLGSRAESERIRERTIVLFLPSFFLATVPSLAMGSASVYRTSRKASRRKVKANLNTKWEEMATILRLLTTMGATMCTRCPHGHGEFKVWVFGRMCMYTWKTWMVELQVVRSLTSLNWVSVRGTGSSSWMAGRAFQWIFVKQAKRTEYQLTSNSKLDLIVREDPEWL